MVIPVINVISVSEKIGVRTTHSGKHDIEALVAQEQKRFQEMRARLLGQDQPD